MVPSEKFEVIYKDTPPSGRWNEALYSWMQPAKGSSSEEQIMEEGSKQKGNCTVENYEYITSAMWSK